MGQRSSISRASPWILQQEDDAVLPNGISYGGPVKKFSTGTANIKVGDPVYKTAVDGQVASSATVADFQAAVGIVVGGKNLGETIYTDWIAGSRPIAAVAAGDYVYVAVEGAIVPVESGGAVVCGAKVTGFTTAGLVDDASNTAGQRLGTALQAAAGANVKFAIIVQVH